MRIGQIAVGQKRSLRIQFSPERVLDMPILRVEIPEPWRPRRLRRAARALRKRGGERVTRAMRMSALKLCPEVKNLLIAAPVGGAGLQAELRREYGVPALEDAPGRAPDLAIHFAPSAGGSARIVDLSGNSPRMDHFSFALREQALPEDCEGLPLLAALWETGRLDPAEITVFTDFHS